MKEEESGFELLYPQVVTGSAEGICGNNQHLYCNESISLWSNLFKSASVWRNLSIL